LLFLLSTGEQQNYYGSFLSTTPISQFKEAGDKLVNTCKDSLDSKVSALKSSIDLYIQNKDEESLGKV
jgi:hypothetical protein